MAEVVRGFEIIAGYGLESTAAPNTEVAVTQKIRLLSESFQRQYTHIQDPSLQGDAGMTKPDQGVAQIGGSLTVGWDYTADNQLLRQFFGTFTTGATTVTPNQYQFAQVQDDITGSLAIGKQNDVFSYTGTKFHSMQIAGQAGEAVTLQFDGFAMGETINSATNTTAVLGGLSAPPARVLFHHCADNFRIGDLANTLTSDDGFKPSGFTIQVNRQGTQFHTNTQLPEQSRENGFASVDVTLSFPTYTSTQWTQWHIDHTALQLQARFVNPAATDQTETIRLVKLYVVNAPVPVSAPGLVAQTVTLTGHHDLESANLSTEFGFTEPIRIVETI